MQAKRHFKFRLKTLGTALMMGTALVTLNAHAHSSAPALEDVAKVWTYNHSTATPGQIAEILAFDPLTKTLWVVGNVLDADENVLGSAVDVLNAVDGSLVQHIDTTGYGNVNSVAVQGGIAAMAFESATDRTSNGKVVLFDTTTRMPAMGVNEIEVGPLPDMVAFTHDGSRLLVANEATPSDYTGFDPAGSVSIIDMDNRTVVATPGFDGIPTEGSHIRGKAAVGMDYEPEYIAVAHNGRTAYVTLQEANAIGVLDLASNAFSKIIGLGVKDFSEPGNEIDPNHKDDKIELRAAQVKGLYQPDAIAAYDFKGKTYLVMANEGDTREDDGDKVRVKDSGLTGYPDDLKQLNISTVDSTSGTDLITFGGRSFSIRDEDGNIVFDSGNQLDAAAIDAGIYNDSRSDDKGVEPEGVKLFKVDGRTLAFIGLERTTTSAVAVYDVTNPYQAAFLDMIVVDGDVSPEGLEAFRVNGKNYLAIANEVSGTTSVVQFDISHSKTKGHKPKSRHHAKH